MPASVLALLSIMVSSIAAAQDEAVPVVNLDAIRTVADEYVAQTFDFDAARLGAINSGWVFPPRCTALEYPTLEVGIGEEAHGTSHATANRIYSAVNAAYVKQNRIRLGIDMQRAQAWTDAYFTDLEAARPGQPAIPVSAAALSTAAGPDRGAVSPQIKVAHATPGPQLRGEAARVAEATVKPPIQLSRLAATVWQKDRLALRTSAQIRTRPDGQGSPASRLARLINAASPKPADFPSIIDTMSGTCFLQGPLKLQTPHLFKLQPATGSVFVIPEFSFRLCALKTADPYDRDKCREWTDVSNDQTPLLGRYQISAEWADGGLNRAPRNFRYRPGHSFWPVALTPQLVP